MDYDIFELLKLIGSLGVFLYGMKLMSESLQKLAGNKMRQILTAMTSNRITGVLTGIFITALIQSSSATTVMVVSFVNAGLLDLVGSIGVILGANVGTTVTSWLVAGLGLGEFSMSDLALPIIGCTLPLLFSKNVPAKTGEKCSSVLVFCFWPYVFCKNPCQPICMIIRASEILYKKLATLVSAHG